MKKKISSILAVMLTVIMLAGCGSKASASSVVEDHFKDINKGANSEFVKSIVSENVSTNELSKEGQDAIFNMLAKLEVKVKNETVDGDTAKVDVTVKGVNFGTIMQAYIAKLFESAFSNPDITEAEIEKLATDLLIKSIDEAAVEERDCTLNLTKVNGEWTITEDEAFSKALFGLTEEDLDKFMAE